LWIAYSAPVFSPTQVFGGALTIRIDLNEFNGRAHALQTSIGLEGSYVLMMTSNGMLLGSNLGFPPFSCKIENHCVSEDVKPISQFTDSLILSNLHSLIIQQFGSYGNIYDSYLDLTVGDVTYVAYFSKDLKTYQFSPSYNLVYLVPRRTLYAKSDRQQIMSMSVSIVIVFAVIGLSIPVLNAVIRPLTKIKDEMIGIFLKMNIKKQVFSDDFTKLLHEGKAGSKKRIIRVKTKESKSHRLSKFTDIQELQVAFNRMGKVIKAFEKFVPIQSVKAILYNEPLASELYVKKVQVGIFFSDIKDFTTMAETLSSERLIHLLAMYFAAMTKILETYNGVVGGMKKLMHLTSK
jgi:hypothetical protein